MSKLNLEYESFKAEDTREFAKMLAKEAKEGQIYLLSGDLGTGKTAFAQGFAQGLGIEDYVNSPTFTIMQIYDKGRLTLYHFDVYRIGDSSEMDELGYEEYFFGNGVCLIEWPSVIEEYLPNDMIRVTISKNLDKGLNYRLIEVENDGSGN